MKKKCTHLFSVHPVGNKLVRIGCFLEKFYNGQSFIHYQFLQSMKDEWKAYFWHITGDNSKSYLSKWECKCKFIFLNKYKHKKKCLPHKLGIWIPRNWWSRPGRTHHRRILFYQLFVFTTSNAQCRVGRIKTTQKTIPTLKVFLTFFGGF